MFKSLCGIHIHVGAEKLTAKTLRDLVKTEIDCDLTQRAEVSEAPQEIEETVESSSEEQDRDDVSEDFEEANDESEEINEDQDESKYMGMGMSV